MNNTPKSKKGPDNAARWMLFINRIEAIADGGTDELERRKRMGAGFKHIQELIDGEHLDIYTISFVEHGIMKHEHKPDIPCRY